MDNQTTKKIGSCAMIWLLCFVPLSAAHARPLARPQRQVLSGELATGLTGTGTSFNPLYEGQSVIDSYYGYQPEQRYLNTYDDIMPQLDGAYRPMAGINHYDRHHKGTYGTKGVGNFGGYGQRVDTHYGGGGLGIGGSTGWRGFGAGRGYAKGARSSQYPQYGVKY